MLQCGNIVIIRIRVWGVTKHTILTAVSLLVLHKVSFCMIGTKTSYSA